MRVDRTIRAQAVHSSLTLNIISDGVSEDTSRPQATESTGKNNPDKNANPDLTEEQRLLGPWVERMAAYRRYYGKSRESASNQGAAPVRGRKSATARPLRDILLAHRGEVALHKECYAYGIPYRRPRTLRLHGENTPVDGRFGRPRRLHSLRNLTSDLSRKLLPHKQARRRGPRL